jgi:TIR domain
MMTRGPLNVFIAYEQTDTHFYEELIKRLLPIQREGALRISSHSTVEVGTEWEQEIARQIKRSSLILLLISPDFMASEQSYTVELKLAMDCYRAGSARVVPIILRSTNTSGAPFEALRSLPKNGPPLADQNIDEALNSIIQELRAFIGNISQSSPLTTSLRT